MRIGILGLGLIGGSLGYDFRRLGHTVLGGARRQVTCDRAIVCGAVDQASTDLDIFGTVEVVFVCTPIAVVAPTVAALRPYLQSNTVVTDVGSVKSAIVYEAAEQWPLFLGGHPMAGKTEVGIEAAQPALFAHRAYVLTPTEQTSPEAMAILKPLVNSLEAEVFVCSPENHDRAVAWISHLPVMVSGSLIQACLHEDDIRVRKLAQQFASSGFCDTSRVGGGHPELGLMMARYNRTEVMRSLTAYRAEIDHLIQLISQEHWDTLADTLAENHQARDAFL